MRETKANHTSRYHFFYPGGCGLIESFLVKMNDLNIMDKAGIPVKTKRDPGGIFLLQYMRPDW